MKKISLIIPCYNCEKTLRRCLSSVFEQTYKNVEIIAVNDGSTDGTLCLLREFEKTHENLIVLDKANGGVSTARNLALKNASGEYVEFMDSDDNFLSSTVLEKLVFTLETNNVDMVVFNFTHPCFESHLKTGLYDLSKKDDLKTFYQDFFASSLPWNKLFKKETIVTTFDESMSFAEDEIFNLENMVNMQKIYYLEDVLYNYYCEPLVDKKNASLVNRLYVSDNFWLNKNTIWYKSISNMEKREKVFDKFYKEEKTHFTFVRPFDFFFYDFAFMSHLKVLPSIKKKQCGTILETPQFQELLSSLSAYGLRLKHTSRRKLKECMNEFADYGSFAFEDIKQNYPSLKLYIVLFTIFGKCFFKPNRKLDSTNILAKTQNDLKYFKTEESKYVGELLSSALCVSKQMLA